MDSDWPHVIAKLTNDAEFVARFRHEYSDGLTEVNIIDAIATYMRALVVTDSAFDRYLSGDEAAISPEAKEGYRLFLELGCVSCHQGPNVGGNMYQRFGVIGDYFADRGNQSEADLGRYNVTGRERDKYVFKVPSLRNVANTAPYFHDGSAETLEDAVSIMIEYQLGRSVDADQRSAIIAFLSSLAGEVGDELL
jgi:cytochrome c peroxidase